MNNVNVEKGKQGFQPRPKGEPAAMALTAPETVAGREYVRATEVERHVEGTFMEVWATHKVDGRDFTVNRFFTVEHDDGDEAFVLVEHRAWGFDGEESEDNVRVEGQHAFDSLNVAFEEQQKLAASADVACLEAEDWMFDSQD